MRHIFVKDSRKRFSWKISRGIAPEICVENFRSSFCEKFLQNAKDLHEYSLVLIAPLPAPSNAEGCDDTRSP